MGQRNQKEEEGKEIKNLFHGKELTFLFLHFLSPFISFGTACQLN